ncbi:hypothetical protein OKW98_23975 [Pseudomonas sp. KU26590]|uniref:hypothetical protein n=1 Tax=Pseudomonas sp. KU26590 TaxID=2991051 RepID=UPI00223E8910|nr:hypothetical protein [Pseudomonas sp. KU26590]UZJ59566.1 hypothetical protein OKW98_23975 [Pseudomonas sp. KU26590]
MINSAEEFIALRSSDLKNEYDRAAMEEAPISVWREIIIKYPNYRRWVSHNKTVPLEILEELCIFDSTIRQSVARKRKLSLAMFEMLSKDVSDVVRVAIAANRKTPIAILERLLTDKDEDVASVARLNLDERKIRTIGDGLV